jgi:hypothetical protein
MAGGMKHLEPRKRTPVSVDTAELKARSVPDGEIVVPITRRQFSLLGRDHDSPEEPVAPGVVKVKVCVDDQVEIGGLHSQNP